MTQRDSVDLENIAQRLRAIHHELEQLNTRVGGSAIEQAALSTEMALGWLDLLLKLESKES